jgi:pSer/pThr/pTyr-binding forkhead associated (FHA) protein
VLRPQADHWTIQDENSTNGTYADGRRVREWGVGPGSVIHFGSPSDGPRAVFADKTPQRPPGAFRSSASGTFQRPTTVRPLPARTVRIGRGGDNDLVIDDLVVSRRHAELLAQPDGTYEILDLGSHNGTFLNGQPVTRAPVTPGDIVGIGHSAFRLVGDELQEYVDTGEVSLDVQELTVAVDRGRKILLDQVSFPVGEKCLLAVVGPSGAGKSTLLNALTGQRPADRGAVLYDGRDLYRDYAELRQRIGLVPQDDIGLQRLTGGDPEPHHAPADTGLDDEVQDGGDLRAHVRQDPGAQYPAVRRLVPSDHRDRFGEDLPAEDHDGVAAERVHRAPRQALLQRAREQPPAVEGEAGDPSRRPVEDGVLDPSHCLTAQGDHRSSTEIACGHQLAHHTSRFPNRSPRRTAMTVPDRLLVCTQTAAALSSTRAATTTTSHIHQSTVHLRAFGPRPPSTGFRPVRVPRADGGMRGGRRHFGGRTRARRQPDGVPTGLPDQSRHTISASSSGSVTR